MDTEYFSPSLFNDEDKPFVLTDLSFCEKSENKSKDFVKNSTILQIENMVFQ